MCHPIRDSIDVVRFYRAVVQAEGSQILLELDNQPQA